MKIEKIFEDISRVLAGAAPELARAEYVFPPQWAMGQVGVPVFQAAKKAGKNPKILADEVSQALAGRSLPATIRAVSAAGPYLNFHLNWDAVANTMRDAMKNGAYLKPVPKRAKDRPVLIEYSSPNLAKPMAFHHIRSTMIGHVTGNFFEFCGYPVIRYIYPGDMGTGMGKLCVGAEKMFGADWMARSYTIDELYRAYTAFQEMEENPSARVKAAEWTRKIEFKDAAILPFHENVYAVTKRAFEKIFNTLGVHFDVWDGEFNYANRNNEVIKFLKKVPRVSMGESDGAKVLYFENDALPSLILIKSDNTSVYLARDILSALHRLKQYAPSHLIYVVGMDQTLHFQQLGLMLENAGLIEPNADVVYKHIHYGLVSLKGAKMSTRKGTVVFLEDVIDEAAREMKKRMGQKTEIADMDQMARKIAVGAVIFSDLVHAITKNVSFRWDDILNAEGDTGPYIFYAYARLSGILRKMGIGRDDIAIPDTLRFPDAPQTAHEVLFKIAQFHLAVNQAMRAYDPSIFARYVLSLAKLSNAFYHAYPVKDEPDPDKKATLLWLVTAIQTALKQGAALLNMDLLESL